MHIAESKIQPFGKSVDSRHATRLVAADNEFEAISDDIFPDIDNDAVFLDDDDEEAAKGLQFRGLEVLDLHNNLLPTVPLGLRRLERLTVINLVS